MKNWCFRNTLSIKGMILKDFGELRIRISMKEEISVRIRSLG